jgi:hypothetical protein
MSTIPIDETLRALDDPVRSGQVRYLGTSTFAAWQRREARWVSKALGLDRAVCEQPPYRLLDRRIERQVVPMAETAGFAVTLVPPGWRLSERSIPAWRGPASGQPSGSARGREGPALHRGRRQGTRGDQGPAAQVGSHTRRGGACQGGGAAMGHQPDHRTAQGEGCLGAVHVRLAAEDRKRLDAVASPGQVVVPYDEADFGPHGFRWSCAGPPSLATPRQRARSQYVKAGPTAHDDPAGADLG